MLALTSNITIGNFTFSGVHSVKIKRSIHTYVDTAVIELPAICRVLSKDKNEITDTQTTGQKFNEGDPVTIELGYNGENKEEFRGFVSRRNLNMPLQIECEGYSYKLRSTTISGTWKDTSIKELANIIKAAAGLKDVIVQDDISINKISSENGSCAALLDRIKKETNDAITIFFVQPDVLWIGLLFTQYANNNPVLNLPTTKYRIGYNCMDNNSLKERGTKDDPVQVTFFKKQINGDVIKGISKSVNNGRHVVKLLGHISATDWLDSLAKEKAYNINYMGYEGALTGFLTPYTLPGFTSYVQDKDNPDQAGTYLVDTTEINYGQNGARRTCELSHKLGWNVADS